jgi:predicted permease
MRAAMRRLIHWFGRSRHDADLREEIETHRALRQAALERDGLSPEDAAAASRRALGNLTLAVEDVRDVWSLGVLDRLHQDLRAAGRGLAKSRGFTLVTIATLALGIGANAALFSIFNSLILRPLPVRDPGGLILLAGGDWTYPIWQEVRRFDGTIFEGVFAWSGDRFDLSRAGQTEFVDGAYISGRGFDVLGVSAVRGRVLQPADDGSGGDAAVAVISHRLWQQRFSGEDDAIGRQLRIERVPFTIVGVMPPGFFGPDVGRAADVMIPFAAEPLIRGAESALTGRSTWWLEIMARLKPGVSVDETTAALRGVQSQIRGATLPDWPAQMLPNYLNEAFTFVPAAQGRSSLRDRFERPLLALVVAVGLVLLVACANIASLFLARTLARRPEFSVRLALGASRWRIARLMLAESALVGAAGAGIGLVVARWGSALLVRQLNTWDGAVFLDLALDWRVLGFTAALACLSALTASVAPVLGIKRVAPGEALKDAGRGVIADRRVGVRAALVVAQLAISIVLVIGAGLFLRTLTSLNRVPLGFVPEPLLVVNLRPSPIAADQRLARFERLREAAAAIPGVTSTAVSLVTPVSGQGWNNWFGDSPVPPADRGLMTWMNAVTPGWFHTMGIPLRRGRDFTSGDRIGTTPVAIVNESFARRFLPGDSPVGRIVRLGGNRDAEYQIVGVTGDAVYRNPREGMMPTLYLPMAQRLPNQIWSTATLTIATMPGSRASGQREVAAALTRVDPGAAFTFRTFDQLVDATVTQERLVAMLAAFFGALALLLAGVGLYGIVAHAVRARRSEIGIRMALGAEPASIVRLVFHHVGVLVVVGVSLGLLCSLAAARYVQALLFQLDARDPVTFAAAAAVLMIIGIAAAWVPAASAGRLDPAAVLREG